MLSAAFSFSAGPPHHISLRAPTEISWPDHDLIIVRPDSGFCSSSGTTLNAVSLYSRRSFLSC